MGEYIRMKETCPDGGYKVGDVFRAKPHAASGVNFVDKDGDSRYASHSSGRFELWQPRVGERVRVVRAELSHKSNSIGREFTVTHEAYKVGNGLQTWGGDNAGGLVWRADELEPILTTAPTAQPATLKIEAGKFYKTRDGRKVGPAFLTGGCAVFGDRSNYASAVWSDDGRSSNRDDKLSLKDNDIIAEWIDEPAAKASNDNTTPKFKAGDRVRVVKGGFVSGGSGHGAKVGNEFVLKEMDPSKAFWRTNGPDFYEHEIELVVVAAIVALIENGQPKPSSTPRVHASTCAAETEAKRLAAKYKGKQFGVFTLTTTHHEPKPVHDHKWQNLAALGLKIDAISSLETQAGITTDQARRIVYAFAA
ncbi:hypothetical protein [Agrobacterium tumefaciens]|uniref:hypothetical protein n=1 Tax=Agrobacterium tumefaciens TaxID=358 RepID=UPI0021CF616D|nr:hypothetical protein [Agrobacterium tumefaciens]UXR99981.1 hypothetical protein FY156_09425 [Agrobacterium tumefaciens]